MNAFWGSQAFERDDFLADGPRHRQHAGTNRAVVDQDGARAALAEAAAEPGVVQGEVVAQGVQQRTIEIDINDMHLPVHFQ